MADGRVPWSELTYEQRQRIRWVRGQQAGMRQAQRRFLAVYQVSGDVRVAMAASGRSKKTVADWEREDAGFREQYREMRAFWEMATEEVMKSLGVRAAEVLAKVLHDPKADMKLQVEVAMRVLRSQGLLPDKGQVEAPGPGVGPAPISITQVVVVQPGARVIEGEQVGESLDEGSGRARPLVVSASSVIKESDAGHL